MRQRFISGMLFMVLMIVVMHYATPHHHHHDFAMYDHEIYDGKQCSHSGDDRQPVQCLIQSINLDIPRELQTVRLMNQTGHSPPAGELMESIPLFDGLTGWAIVHAPPGGSPLDGSLTDIPARGPPC